jgi:hypothetical protein
MHICGHVFIVLKYNLLAKHPTFTEFINEYYYVETQNWTENDEPFNEPPIWLKMDLKKFNSIECPPITKNFWEYYIEKNQISPKKLQRNFQNIILKYTKFHIIIST